MTALDDITKAIERDLQSKPWDAFVRQNPGIAPQVADYLLGGPRPSDTSLGQNHYAHARVRAEDARRALAPAPPPSPGVKLRWSPPSLTNALDYALTNASRVSSALGAGTGRDLRLNARSEVLTGAIAELKGWNDIEQIGGEFDLSTAGSGTIMPREITGVAHFEGIKAYGSGTSRDFFAPRYRVPYMQIENVDVLVRSGATYHSDCFQTQYCTIKELRCDKGTFRTNYQGFFISNEPQQAAQPVPSQVERFILSRWNFRPVDGDYPATWIFKAIPSRTSLALGPWEFSDVWAPDFEAVYHVYPNGYNWKDWNGVDHRYGCFRESRRHANGQTYPFLRFSTSADKVPLGPYQGQACGDCGIGGEGGVWLHPESGGPPGGDFAPADAGLGYVPPGYL
jgi:hypothetical protein